MTDESQLVSIVMATYNGSKYLAVQLDSIINQTYKTLEIIIVDDASSDSTVEIIKNYQQRYTFIKLFQNSDNQGVVRSFSYALSKCRGDYVALADQDDVWFSTKIERLISNIGDCLLIHSDAVLVDSHMQIITDSHFRATGKDKNKTEFIDYLISNNVTGCTALCSRKLLSLSLPIPGEFYVHDHYLAIIASFYGKVKFLNEPLVYYRQHSNNAIGAGRPSFEVFIKNSGVVANSYDCLLKMPAFIDNYSIQILRDYRLSIYYGRWVSQFSIFKILHLKNGAKLYIYYLLLVGLGKYLGKKIYNLIYWK